VTLSKTPSLPPSEPRSSSQQSRASIAELGKQDRATKIQMLIMLGLGVVLVSVPLYFWRRPPSNPSAEGEGQAGAPRTDLSAFTPTTAAGGGGGGGSDGGVAVNQAVFSLGEARVLSCRDTRKDLPECGKLPAFEEALAKAVRDHASCLPETAGGGSIQYVAEVNFAKKKIALSTPKDGRTVRNVKLLKPCVLAIKRTLDGFPIDKTDHGHTRYKVSVVATYPGGSSTAGK
jgi:hypothetical protein